MSGGITQLVAIGAQDAHIVGDPQVSFFRSSYKRHTNFAQVVDRQIIQGTVNAGNMSTVRFERKGDLVGYVYMTRSDSTGVAQDTDWRDYIDKVELLIGGQIIDTQDSVFTEDIAVDTLAYNLSKSSQGVHGGGNSLIYPLRFSFCENWQSALPLVALQYHDVELRIYWGSSTSTSDRMDLFSNFIYLDTNEREEMISKPHDMLITQVQKITAPNSKIAELVFNHPVKFLASKDTTALTVNNNKIKLQINGTDVSESKAAKPNFVEAPAYFHMPSSTAPDIFVYPFCLDTSKLQPTGSLNFSRLDSARIISESANIEADIYAVNYNILRIQNGMGGVVYAN